MNKIVQLTPHFAVAGVLHADDFARAAALGFRAIVSNRPDGEAPGQLSGAEEAALAAAAGLAFRHLPATKHDVLGDAMAGAMTDALRQLPGPVLAHCASGIRSAIAWAAAAARSQPAACVLAALADAGFQLEAIREELEEKRSHDVREACIPAALDCRCHERHSDQADA